MSLLQLFETQLGALALASTLLLGAGVLAVRLHRQPLHRQRIAELALLATGLWLVLALVPLPRLEFMAETEPAAAPRETAPPPEASTGPAATARPSAAEAFGMPPETALLPAPPAVEASVAPPASAAAIRQPAAATPGLDWAQILVRTYLAGSALALLWLAAGWVRLRRFLAASRPAPRRVHELAAELSGPGRPVPRLRVAERPCRPFSCGLLHPTVVLPAELVGSQPPAALCPVLRHELAHVRQRDACGQWLFALALPMLWGHPLFWWLRREHRLTSELVADDLAGGGEFKHEYARELIGLAESRLGAPRALAASSPVFASPSDFYKRMNMLLARNDRLATRCSRARRSLQTLGCLGLLALATALWGARPAAAQEPQQRERMEQIERYHAELQRLRQDKAALEKQLAELKLRMELAPEEARPRAAVERVAPVLEPAPGGRGTGHSAAEPVMTVSAPTLDLVMRSIDLSGELQLAEIEMKQLRELAEAKAVSSQDLIEAEIKLETLHRKRQVLHSLIRAEIGASKTELEEAQKRQEAGLQPRSRAYLQRLHSRIEILSSAL